MKKSLIFLTIMVLVLVSCELNSSPVDPTAPIPTDIPTTVVGRKTNSSSTNEPLATLIITLTPTSLFWGYAKPTPLPTLPIELKAESINAYLDSNGECSFPCYWGINPGSSSVHDLNVSLSQIADSIYINYLKEESSESKYVFEHFYEFLYPGNPQRNMRHSYKIENTIITTISADIDLSVSSLLKEYGIPSNILIYVTGTSQSIDQIPFSILFYYEELDFLVVYHDDLGVRSGEFVTGCFDREQGKLFSWAPDHRFRISEIPEFKFSGAHMPINEVTNTNMEEFFLRNKNADEIICVETSLQFWE